MAKFLALRIIVSSTKSTERLGPGPSVGLAWGPTKNP